MSAYVPVSDEAAEPVGVGVDEELDGEGHREEEVELVGERAELGRGAVCEDHVCAELCVDYAHSEVLQGWGGEGG